MNAPLLTELPDDPNENARENSAEIELEESNKEKARALKGRLSGVVEDSDDKQKRKIYGSLFTSLHRAAAVGDAEGILFFLLRERINVNSLDRQGASAACHAAEQGQIEALRLLFEHGADMTIKNRKSWTPAHCAAVHGHFGVFEFLKIKCGANLSEGDLCGSTPAHFAAGANHVTVLEKLHELNEPLDLPAGNGCTPAHHAAQNEALESLRVLHHLSYDLNTPDKFGDTPAHKAARFGRYRALKVLEELGCNMKAMNIDGDTPLKLLNLDETHAE